MLKKYTEEQLRDLVSRSKSMSDFMVNMGCRIIGGNRGHWAKVIKSLDIDTSHFDRSNRSWETRYKPAICYLKKGSKINNCSLKNKLFIEGIKDKKCEMCGLTEWMKSPICLDLHHIDGDHTNNEIENIIILCSNCHSFVHGYGVKKTR